MSWDENIFKLLFERYQKLRNKESITGNTQKVVLTYLISRLEIMASALAEMTIQIYPTRNELGQTRNKSIVLPGELNFFKDATLNESLYICRTGFSSLVIREWHKNVNSKIFNQQNWIQYTTKIALQEFPGLMSSLAHLDQAAEKLDKKELWSLLSRGTFPLIEIDSQHSDDEAITLDSLRSLKNEAKVENLKPSLAKSRTLDTHDPNPAVHVFEKALTAEDYQGGKRNIDSDEDSSDMTAALSELNMDQVVRATGETGSTYNGGLFLDESHIQKSNANPKNNEKNLFYYPEWSKRKLQFIQNWCTVFEEKLHTEILSNSQINPLITKEANRLRRKLEALVNKPVWIRNQQEGSEFDMESLVRFKADVKSGFASINNLYINRHKTEQDIALLVLADTSLSTDAWVANKRVLETIQQSLTILSETFHDLPYQVALAAFYSNTRNHCTYLRIKDFQEKWNYTPGQIAALKPQGYTRIGPAVRHATHTLENIKARKKILLVISDSKPTDYDAYEGAHGEADVHHAILEARTKCITVKGLAVAAPRSGHVKRIYGKNGFESFTDASGLSERIIRVYSEAIN